MVLLLHAESSLLSNMCCVRLSAWSYPHQSRLVPCFHPLFIGHWLFQEQQVPEQEQQQSEEHGGGGWTGWFEVPGKRQAASDATTPADTTRAPATGTDGNGNDGDGDDDAAAEVAAADQAGSDDEDLVADDMADGGDAELDEFQLMVDLGIQVEQQLQELQQQGIKPEIMSR